MSSVAAAPTSAATGIPTISNTSVHSKLFIILIITLPLIVLLALVMGIVHCILKRHRRKLNRKLNPDIEANKTLDTRNPRLPRIDTAFASPPTTTGPSTLLFPSREDRLANQARRASIQAPVQLARHASATGHIIPSRNTFVDASGHLSPTHSPIGCARGESVYAPVQLFRRHSTTSYRFHGRNGSVNYSRPNVRSGF